MMLTIEINLDTWIKPDYVTRRSTLLQPVWVYPWGKKVTDALPSQT
jgi:hypothetical protein